MRDFFSSSIAISGASVLLVFAFLVTTEATGQQKIAPPNQLAVDTVMVKKLGRLHGVVLDEDDRAVSIEVRRAWLEESFPEFAKKHFATEEKTLAEDSEKVKQRLESWRNEYEKDDRQVIDSFVDNNVKLLGLDEPVDVSKLLFTIVKLDPKLVRRTYRQGSDKHRLASIAWKENIDQVETTRATVLKKKLEEQKIDIENYALNMSDEIPIWLESDEDWEVRKSLMEFGLLSRVEFQGSNGRFFRRGSDRDAAGAGDVGDAMKAMLQGGGLGLPGFQDTQTGRKRNDDAWMKPMIEAAEKESRRCFSVSNMTQGQAVTVEIRLYHKVAGNQWVPLVAFLNSESVAQQSAVDVDVVAGDPNVTSVIEMAKQLGVADQTMLEMALKSGSATKKALSKSMAELDKFVNQYSFEIDNPPIDTPSVKKKR